ncbi:taurine catabolism dioxygenase [Boletus edulis BED1]|uniref:Taurine catabolism dioxygenase n=1 Tax=Boletus edulis BED1 TaxID=1328754 RepID=A0AAD4BQ78_BOLED|nr:taurine catabolism dioxygenase [Boletus edulis BED1]
MTIELTPLQLPASADPSYFVDFGREVKGVNPAPRFTWSMNAFYPTSMVPSCSAMLSLTPEQQYALTKAFVLQSETYGHGNNKTESTKKSILRYIKPIPRVPQVQLIGNAIVLKHPSHTTFHNTRISEEDEAKGYTRFCRWHMDAALYEYEPSPVTTLHGITVPKGDRQTVRYDDGTGDELSVPLAPTAFVSGKTMFKILPPELKNLAVRASVRYAPHPYVWMAPARALPTGLGIEGVGLEVPVTELPDWEESKVKTYPVLWKNPVTGDLHFQVHSWAARELIVDPLPRGAEREGVLYPDGAHIKDLEEVRALLYKMQRPGIAPHLVYPHDWRDKDLILFHNRGLMHSVVGALEPDQIRVFHQCNLAASDAPAGPTEDDIFKWT